MQTYVLMTKLSPADANLVELGGKMAHRARNNRSWIEEIKSCCPEVKFLAHYALLGSWDFMDIYQAPDEETAAKVSLFTRSHGHHLVESWTAIPYDRIQQIEEELSNTGTE